MTTLDTGTSFINGEINHQSTIAHASIPHFKMKITTHQSKHERDNFIHSIHNGGNTQITRQRNIGFKAIADRQLYEGNQNCAFRARLAFETGLGK